MDDRDAAPIPLRTHSSAVWRWLGWALALGTACGVIVYLVWGVGVARESARQTSCRGRLSKLQLAMHNYHDVYGCFPPAYVADADGRPMHSWRVLILPFLEERDVYSLYRFDQRWDSPHNRRVAGQLASEWFLCPSHHRPSGSTRTDYVVIVGPETIFPGPKSTSLSDLTDGPGETIMLAEIADSDIDWLEPRDLHTDDMSWIVNDPHRPSISGPHPSGAGVVFADRITAYRLQTSIQPATVRALVTISGRESVKKERLILQDQPSPYSLGE